MGRVSQSRSLILGLLALALVAVPAHAQTLTVLHSFSGPDGALPRAGLTIDRGGKIYGSTWAGFLGVGWGSIFQLRPVPHGPGFFFTVIELYDGEPLDRPVIGPNGTLYGANSNMLTVYKHGYIWNMSPPIVPCKSIQCFWPSTTLYGFTDDNEINGSTPAGATLVFDHAGNIYGTTLAGGSGNGVVYQVTSGGDETPIYSFNGTPDGASPYSGVIFDSLGNLFGVTEAGGASGNGAIYELSPNGNGWTEQIIYNFTGGNDGSSPMGALVMDAGGNFYGTTINGGTGGGGTAFELSPNGSGGWNFSTIYSFVGGADCGPHNDLSFDTAGNLYGTTFCDGSLNKGSIFKLTNSGGSWTYTSIHDFANGADGEHPISNVIWDSQGRMYGTTSYGGMFGAGNVWQITR